MAAFQRLAIDAGLAGLLLASLACRLTGNRFHEWAGLSFLALIVIHLAQHWRWKWLTPLNAPLLAVTLAFLASALFVSREVFVFIGLEGGRPAQKWHLALAYWVLILSSVHMGWHWDKVVGRAYHNKAFFGLGAIISIYGLVAFCRKELWLKLIWYYTFDFWDYDKPALLFFIDYLSIMVFCIFTVYYIRRFFRKT